MAVTLDAITLRQALSVHPAEAERILPVAKALVERYAPGAPDEMQNEAVIRTAGWLCEQPGAAIRSESTGDIETAYAPSMMSALRHSGAMALLSPWKIRRAGVI